MKMKQLYKPKSLNKEDIYRNFMSIYYYLLFNEKPDNYYKKIIKYFYKERTELFQKFFYDNFLSEPNLFFFTLYNQLPIEFLPFPKVFFYFYYPIISFKQSGNSKNYYSPSKIELNEKLINYNEVIDRNLFWREYLKYYFSGDKIKKIKDINGNIEGENDTDIYDNYQFYFDIDYLNVISSDFINNKLLMIFTENPIITNDFKFNQKKKIIIIFKYFIKLSQIKYEYKEKHTIIEFKNIKYISIYDKITKNKIEKCFQTNILNKNTYLYSQLNNRNINENKDKTTINDMFWFNLTPYVRILDPLYLSPDEKYYYREYITNENIELLNISSNIYVNNELINENYKDYDLKNFANNDIKFTDYDIVNSNRTNVTINYNKKNGLSFILWKNKIYTDKTINFQKFLISLNIKSYFNLMSFVKLKTNEIKFLGEELYIGDRNISLVNNYTTDISKFNLYKEKDKYENIYYKPLAKPY